MNIKQILCIVTCTLLFRPLCMGQSTLYVDYMQKGAEVPSSMYGIFFEELSHAGDGGLYAELIQNRNFEEHVIPSGMTLKGERAYARSTPNYLDGRVNNFSIPWKTDDLKFTGWSLTQNNCWASMDIVNEKPLHPHTPHALKLEISGMQKGGNASVVNSGYWGIPVRKGEKYSLRFYLCPDNYKGKVTAKICKGDAIYASRGFTVSGHGKWKEYTVEFTAADTVYDATFQLEFESNGTVLIDYVSLFPKNTFKHRKNGLRPDLAQLLADLNPSFMRWPGGCVVEGMTIENRIKWKETLGDPMTRPGEWDRWGYRTTLGLGYHEFLQFCEDMGADAMFVANVGIACYFNNGDFIDKSEFEAYIQDIRDAIEYATGDVTTKWGAKRAAAGHPKPFPLKYVELGNENWGAYYAETVYNAFYQALKPDYPDITFISTLEIVKELPLMEKADMIDPHYYKTMEWFFNNAFLYDGMQRKDYKVYVGEYACNQNVGTGHIGAALSEAAFMSGMERNADMVTMSSYAPLIENSNRRSWPTNLIWVNNEKVVGRSSYYVQKMYAHNRPDYNLPATLHLKNMMPPLRGRVGLGTWATQAEFSDFRVNSKDESRTYYQSDFSGGKADWFPLAGAWSYKNGIYRQADLGQSRISLLNKQLFGDCIIDVKARKTGGKEGFIVVFGGEEDEQENYYQLNIGGWNNSQTAIEKMQKGRKDVISEPVAFTVNDNQWYDIRVVLTEGNKVECYIDGKYIVGCRLNCTGKLQAVSGYDKQTGETIIKVINGTDAPQDMKLLLNCTEVAGSGKVITLSAPSLLCENSFDNPTAIVPVEEPYTGFSNDFFYTFKPYSFTILRIKTNNTAGSSHTVPLWYNPEPSALNHTGGKMMFGDTERTGKPFSKDPHVVAFGGRYLMYYSVHPSATDPNLNGWGIGVAESKDLNNWKRIGEITPAASYEAKGLCAPSALVRNDTVHLFYQTYGNGKNDAICHAWSVDGVNFTRNTTNPIYAPTGDWNCGRAIDAEVVLFKDTYFLYYATRTPDYSTQIMGVATADAGTNFNKEAWTSACDKAILVPRYPWEGKCVEGASVIPQGDWLYMFYAGAYNNEPQQVGLARSKDGIAWEKMSNKPFLANGDPGTWNYCESGHPHIFRASDGKTYLFYQGNDNYGKTWLLSNVQVFWKDDKPFLK